MYIFNVFRPKIYIQQKALDTMAYLCDGDARVGLNSLQLAVQAQMSKTNLLAPDDSPQEILVTEEHVKEGLQRSHILYDKAGKRRCTHIVILASTLLSVKFLLSKLVFWVSLCATRPK